MLSEQDEIEVSGVNHCGDGLGSLAQSGDGNKRVCAGRSFWEDVEARFGSLRVWVLWVQGSPDMKQRDKMRELYAKYAGRKDACVAGYAEAERTGVVARRRDSQSLSPEAYAAALFEDGVRKLWIRDGC